MASFPRRILRGSVLPTAALATALYASSASSVSADDGQSPLPRGVETRPGHSPSGDKLPIYPSASSSASITLIETPHPLSPHIAKAREAVTGVLGDARGYVESGVSRWVKFERRVEGEVKTILPPDESLTPGLIYVLITGLTGSVLSRTRSLPIRFLAPPLFTLAAFPYFLPKTAHNTSEYLLSIERKYFPEFAERQEKFTSTFSSHLGMTVDRLKDVGKEVEGFSLKAVESVENATGLKVGEAVRRGQERVEKEKERLEGYASGVGAGVGPGPKGSLVERVGYVVEQRPVAEIVRPVAEIKPAQPEAKRMV